MQQINKRLRPQWQLSNNTWSLTALILAACGGGGGGGGVSVSGRTPTIADDGTRSYDVPEGEVLVDTDTASEIQTIERQYNVNLVRSEIDLGGQTGRYIVTSPNVNVNVAVELSLSGEDAHFFKLIAKGKYVGIEFRYAPDFENPQDSNFDNIYKFTLVGSGYNGQRTVEQKFLYQAKVKDVAGDADPSPPIDLPAIAILTNNSRRVDLAEGETIVAANVQADVNALIPREGRYVRLDVAEDGNSASLIFEQANGIQTQVTYRLSGTDAHLFKFTDVGKAGTFGGIAFRSAPDYEAPQDSGHDNLYELDLTISGDIVRTNFVNITVRVTDVIGNADPTPPLAVAGQQNLFVDNDDLALANDNLLPSGADII